jgi:hypothetical protein
VQQVHDIRAADELLVEGGGAGFGDGLQPVERDHGQDIDELPISIAVARQFARAAASSRPAGSSP